MMDYEATAMVSLGGLAVALFFGMCGAILDERGNKEAGKFLYPLSLFGLGVCVVSSIKALIMYMT